MYLFQHIFSLIYFLAFLRYVTGPEARKQNFLYAESIFLKGKKNSSNRYFINKSYNSGKRNSREQIKDTRISSLNPKKWIGNLIYSTYFEKSPKLLYNVKVCQYLININKELRHKRSSKTKENTHKTQKKKRKRPHINISISLCVVLYIQKAEHRDNKSS